MTTPGPGTTPVPPPVGAQKNLGRPGVFLERDTA